MKILVLIVRILLGLLFLVFGLNGFFMFIPTGPLPSGLAGQFVTVLMQSHYVLVISACQVVGGALLLINRYVPLGLTILGPIIVNIICYHVLLYHMGVGLALVVAILWGIIAFYHRQAFSGLFVQKSP
jgi:putative oxidoreductase